MTTESNSHEFAHLPFALLALAVAVLLASQVGAAKQSATIMKWQSDTLSKQVTSMDALHKQYTDAIKTREDTTVKQSTELQNQLQSLLNDLLDLAKTDDEAKKIVDKWNVQRSVPPGGAATAAPAPATGGSPAPGVGADRKAP